MQYLLIVWVVAVFAAVLITFRRFGRRSARLLPVAVTSSGGALVTFGVEGALWSLAGGGANGGVPGLVLTLFPWGVRLNCRFRPFAWMIPTVELAFSEITADPVRSKLRSEGVRLRVEQSADTWLILWSSQWQQILDALAYHGVHVTGREPTALDWSYQ